MLTPDRGPRAPLGKQAFDPNIHSLGDSLPNRSRKQPPDSTCTESATRFPSLVRMGRCVDPSALRAQCSSPWRRSRDTAGLLAQAGTDVLSAPAPRGETAAVPVYLLAPARNKHHRRSDLNNKHSLPLRSGGWRLKAAIRCGQSWLPPRPLSWACRWWSSPAISHGRPSVPCRGLLSL